MIKFTLTALLIQFPALFIHTVAVASPQNVQEFLPQNSLAIEELNISLEDDVVPPRNTDDGDEVVPPR
jgi:hypothetical protein